MMFLYTIKKKINKLSIITINIELDFVFFSNKTANYFERIFESNRQLIRYTKTT